MALPTAQLGGMASLNVPSYIPIVQTEKRPRLWEQALAQLLTQAGSAAAGKGVDNVMSRDYAAEVGDTPASFMQRLLQGPKVNERSFQMVAQTAKDLAMEQLRAKNEQATAEYGAQQRSLENADNRNFDLTKAILNQRGDNARLQAQMGMSDRDAALRLILAQIAEQGDEARLLEQGNREMERDNAQREFEGPGKRAQTVRAIADTQKTIEETKTARALRELLARGQGQSQGQVNPNIVNDRRRAETQTVYDPKMQRVIDALSPKPEVPINEAQLRALLGVGTPEINQVIQYILSNSGPVQ